MRPRTKPLKPHADRRYGSKRWTLTRRRVLKIGTDGRPTALCFWPDAPPHLAAVPHHTRPVYPGMPDAEFYDERYLVPACQHHNKAEGFLRAGGTPVDPPRRQSIFRGRRG